MKTFLHCPACGERFTDPPQKNMQTCLSCQESLWHNPIPVVLGIIPVQSGGIIVVKRGIEPQYGQWALPGGFLDDEESWQEGLVREVLEETALSFPASAVKHVLTQSIRNGKQILIFGSLPPVSPGWIKSFVPNDEVLALRVMVAPENLAFPLHTTVATEYLSRY